ncbi:MAG TPA: alpha/beta hydrolase [Acidimicrobiia bacterium]|nr:alpha/beta hydrolase [Acidimicrobiia bacterium]
MLDLVESPEPSKIRTADGTVTGYYEYGDPGGVPVIALHGTPACGAGYAWADAPARARGVRFLAPDRPGVGDSDRWPSGRGALVRDYAPYVVAFADALELSRFALIGYSGGGPYALAAAHARPDRIDALAIVAGAGQVGVWASLEEFETADRQLTWLAQHVPWIARLGLSLSVRASRTLPRAALRFVQIEMSAPDRAVLAEFPSARAALAIFTQSARRSARGVVDDYAALGRPWGFRVEDVAVPVHCWHASGDLVVPPRHTDELIRRVDGARLTTWPDEGHLAIVHHIGEVLDALIGAGR